MARDRTMTMVKSEIVLSIIINILARCVSGKASVGLKAVAVLYPNLILLYQRTAPDQFTQCNTLRITDQRGSLGRASRPRIQWS